jgi:hypothetical protein
VFYVGVNSKETAGGMFLVDILGNGGGKIDHVGANTFVLFPVNF